MTHLIEDEMARRAWDRRKARWARLSKLSLYELEALAVEAQDRNAVADIESYVAFRRRRLKARYEKAVCSGEFLERFAFAVAAGAAVLAGLINAAPVLIEPLVRYGLQVVVYVGGTISWIWLYRRGRAKIEVNKGLLADLGKVD